MYYYKNVIVSILKTWRKFDKNIWQPCLWQGHFHSETVIYTQKFILQHLRIKVFFV